MHHRRNTERGAFHGDIQTIKQKSSEMDKDIKTLKQLIEEERNDDFIEQLETNDEKRQSEFQQLLAEIRRVGSEVRDAKRFDVYKQLHQEGESQMDQGGDQMEQTSQEEESQQEEDMSE